MMVDFFDVFKNKPLVREASYFTFFVGGGLCWAFFYSWNKGCLFLPYSLFWAFRISKQITWKMVDNSYYRFLILFAISVIMVIFAVFIFCAYQKKGTVKSIDF